MSYNTSYLSSPDTASVVYPDRLIRPLPKRTLKSRLSQEAAESITYPPALPSTSLPNYSHYGENGECLNDSKVLVQHNGDEYDEHDHEHDHDHDHDHDHYHDHDDHCHHHHHCHHDDDDLDSADDSSHVAVRRSNSYRSSPRSPRSSRHARYGSHGAKGSSSGPDGYDAFENTNNKKKRKIPTSGNLSLHHSSLTNDIAHMGISGDKDGASDDTYYAQGGPAGLSGLGVQGAGRGRNGRKSSGRHPLGVSINGSNARSGPSKYDQNMTANAKAEESKDQGIISAAIANATALLRKPLGKGQENMGVLDQQAKQPPANSQFTFTCESDAKGVTFPEQSLYSPGFAQRNHGYVPTSGSGSHRISTTQGTQTSPSMPAQTSQAPQQPAAGGTAQGKKPRRRRRDLYALAARQRRLQQEYTNLQHPPAQEDIWICEFCEYESIFGQPPHALIRQYEIKDRRERRRLAEKRRLLEKAKLKGRKGKKQTKNAAKAANNAAQQPASQQAYDQLGDDDLDYGYDDDPIPMPAPPQAPAKQPMPGSYNATMGKGGGTPAEGIR